ncbi:DUF4810 domain-containing protein [Oceanimonas sp. NS1]|nr:DUF4810 domain-containing protein [Oceanimonas sp. NS1]
MKTIHSLSLMVVTALLAGCAGPKTLYHWDGYQSSVYQHYQEDGSDMDEQVAVLEESIEEAKAKDRIVAPGLHAHLGLLYANSGRGQQAMEQFELENSCFPSRPIS